VTVTSATKREQSKFDAAAAITVLTQEDIRRSGATVLPEVLRMVPGLNVSRLDAHTWSISARGFTGVYSNKMLVLIDGRVVYTPLFGGVYWDVQDLVMEDIERIEVIRGPGGTLWGANAVNGVINVTTKNSKDTQGVLATGLAGNQEYIGEGRYGGMIGEDTSYRVYGRGFKMDDFDVPSGSPYQAHDAWWQWRLGMRADSQVTENDLVTIQGDFYDGKENAIGDEPPPDFNYTEVSDVEVRGGNVLTRWTHTFSDDQSLEMFAYWDQTRRQTYSLFELRNSVDVLAQHNFGFDAAGKWLVNWGVEYFWTGDQTTPTAGASFVPADQDFHRVSGFAQAQWNLFDDRLQLIGGSKLEWNSYTDFEYQPTAKALWKFMEDNAFWASISRAVREPARADRDVFYTGTIIGNKDIESENLMAVEGGYRNQMLQNFTVDVTGFYNRYGDLAATIPTIPTFLPFQLVNGTTSRAYGVETELAWAPTEGLRFVTSHSYLRVKENLVQNAVQATGLNSGAAPRHTWVMRGLWDVPVVPVELDASVWYVGKLTTRWNPTAGLPINPATSPEIGAYWRFDLRLGWQATDWLGLEVVGQNLTDKSHIEYGESPFPIYPGDYVPRSYYGKVTLTF
jgi:iron complex outermembrane receptor protein